MKMMTQNKKCLKSTPSTVQDVLYLLAAGLCKCPKAALQHEGDNDVDAILFSLEIRKKKKVQSFEMDRLAS